MGELHVIEPRTESFYTIRGAAKLLNVSERYIRNLLESGELEPNHFGRAVRIAPEQIDSLIERTRDRGAA